MAITLNQIINTLQNLASGGLQSDDRTLSERQLAHLINAERALLVKQDLDKNRVVHEAVIQDLGCIEIECVDSAECCDGSITEEYIHRTVLEIPKPLNIYNPLTTSASAFTFVGLVDGITSIEMTSSAIAARAKFKKFTGNAMRAFYRNKRIYITNANQLEVINIRGIFEDPVEAEKFNKCSGESCFSFDSPYPISSYLESILLERLITRFVNPANDPNQQDTSNDTRNRPNIQQV